MKTQTQHCIAFDAMFPMILSLYRQKHTYLFNPLDCNATLAPFNLPTGFPSSIASRSYFLLPISKFYLTLSLLTYLLFSDSMLFLPRVPLMKHPSHANISMFVHTRLYGTLYLSYSKRPPTLSIFKSLLEDHGSVYGKLTNNDKLE